MTEIKLKITDIGNFFVFLENGVNICKFRQKKFNTGM